MYVMHCVKILSQPGHSISVTVIERQLNLIDVENVVSKVFHRFSDGEVMKTSG